MPYCSFAISGLSEMNVNNFLRHVNGIGMMSDMKTTISNIRRQKTCIVMSCQYKLDKRWEVDELTKL